MGILGAQDTQDTGVWSSSNLAWRLGSRALIASSRTTTCRGVSSTLSLWVSLASSQPRRAGSPVLVVSPAVVVDPEHPAELSAQDHERMVQ